MSSEETETENPLLAKDDESKHTLRDYRVEACRYAACDARGAYEVCYVVMVFHTPLSANTLAVNLSLYFASRVCNLGGPISLQAALVFISSLVSLAFAGHLGKLSLSQAVLATSAYNITGVSMLLGLASGMETLCSQVCCFSLACAFMM